MPFRRLSVSLQVRQTSKFRPTVTSMGALAWAIGFNILVFVMVGRLVGETRRKNKIIHILVGVMSPALGTTDRSLPLSCRGLRVIGIRVEVAASRVGSISGGLGGRGILVVERGRTRGGSGQLTRGSYLRHTSQADLVWVLRGTTKLGLGG